MVIPESCKKIINRQLINDRCDPDLTGMSSKQQIRYYRQSCDYLLDVIVQLLLLGKRLESSEGYQPP